MESTGAEQLATGLWSLLVNEILGHGLRHLFWGVVVLVLSLIFGRNFRQRLRALEAQKDVAPSSTNIGTNMVVHGNIYNSNNKPVAKYDQRYTMLDKVIPLQNRQVLMFFVPDITIEYVDGDRGRIELPKAEFEEAVKAMGRMMEANPERFRDWKPLTMTAEAHEEMARKLREAEKGE